MSIAAKHFDPVLGIDVHIVQPPGPVPPVPVPHPAVGMLFDPMDYAPFIGATVKINGMPRAQAGTAGVMIPPHIPIGGVFVKPPSNEFEVFMGSATVATDGDAQSRLGLPALSCSDIGMPGPPRAKGSPPKSLCLPTSVVLSVPMGKPVLVGGPPTISLMALGMKLGMAALGKGFAKLRAMQKSSRRMKAVSDRIHKLADDVLDKLGVKSQKARNRVHRAVCSATGHPVDVATGKVFTDAVDLELPGPIPFRWERVWYSTSAYVGPLGHGWHHAYDHGLQLDVGRKVVGVRLADGRAAAFRWLEVGESTYERREKLTLRRDTRGFSLRGTDGLVFRFSAVGHPGLEQRVTSIEDGHGARIAFLYGSGGRLEGCIDSAGRKLRFSSDAQGRITEIWGPHPELDKAIPLVRYRYDRTGDLREVGDALGSTSRFDYEHHLLKAETDRRGVTFRFEWDGQDNAARCVRTWGPQGVLERRLRYDVAARKTFLTNALGAEIVYLCDDSGLVVEVRDPLGHVSAATYGDDGEKTSSTNEVGTVTSYEYDARGNLLREVSPDGAAATFEYDEHDRLVRAVDVAGGISSWSYDASGRVIQAIDAAQAVSRFAYDGPHLVQVGHANGATSLYGYDAQGNLVSLTAADGARHEWRYDRLGRQTAHRNPLGGVEVTKRDLCGRVASVSSGEGSAWSLSYDGEGNLIRARDAERDLELAYSATGKLVARSENGQRVSYELDREERVASVRSERGAVYRFERDPNGEIVAEIDWGGHRHELVRDPAGRIIEVHRPGGGTVTCAYDALDRLVSNAHSDGTFERFEYRADGFLVGAHNESTSVTYELDPVGRVLRERQGDDWVESTYDALGHRVLLTSSRDARQAFARDAAGELVGVACHTADEAQCLWQARFVRDAAGLERERTMPGQLRSQWERDAFGRPISHAMGAAGRAVRRATFQWAKEDRLVAVNAAGGGGTSFQYDRLGNLAVARHEDGALELRLPDAFGNVYRSSDLADRSYGPAGELLVDQRPGEHAEYVYDLDGNLVVKRDPRGEWRYRWNAAGMLVEVLRPDGRCVSFAYDALGRRTEKRFGDEVTRWVWDGNQPLHEWSELDPSPAAANEAPEGAPGAAEGSRRRRGAITTWLFDDRSDPIARIEGDDAWSIVGDDLGTPRAMFDRDGGLVWSQTLDLFGRAVEVEGERSSCPFRFPGQYEDEETGLYYNRFRYYDPGAGAYISSDPLGLDSGTLNLYAYSPDPLTVCDPLGLVRRRKNGQFAKKPGPKPKPSSHGNSKASTRPCALYAKYDSAGNFEKWGITQNVNNPKARYSGQLAPGASVQKMAQGSRPSMLALERELAEKKPGPQNFESWAGSKKGQPLSARAAAVCAKAGV